MKEDTTHKMIIKAVVSIGDSTRIDIARYIQSHKKATFMELINAFNLNHNTLRFHLRKLKQAHVIAQPKKRGSYTLDVLGELMLRTLEDLEKKAQIILVRVGVKK